MSPNDKCSRCLVLLLSNVNTFFRTIAGIDFYLCRPCQKEYALEIEKIFIARRDLDIRYFKISVIE